MKMTQFNSNNEFQYHLDGHYVDATDEWFLRFSTVNVNSRYPDEKRTYATLSLSDAELDALISQLCKISDSRKT